MLRVELPKLGVIAGDVVESVPSGTVTLGRGGSLGRLAGA
jgi:hypothetical protein